MVWVIYVVLMLLAVAVASQLCAQDAVYNFTGASTGDNQFNSVTTAPSGGTFSTFTRTNVSWTATSNVFNSINWNTAASIDTSEYVSFSITPGGGNIAYLESVAFGTLRSTTGPANGQVSLFGNTSGAAIASQTFAPLTSLATTTFDFSDTIASEALTLRFYGWNAGGASGTLRFDDVTTAGSGTNFFANSANLTLTTGTQVYADSAALTLLGDLTGSGGLTKIGTNTVSLTGTNAYTGDTIVAAGTLQVSSSGSLASGSTVSVNGSSAALSGNGTINGATTVITGQIKPGDSGGASVGTLTFGSSLTLAGSGSASTRLVLDVGSSSASSINDAAGLTTAISGGTLTSYLTSHATSYEAESGTHDKLSITGALGLNANGLITMDNTSGYTFAFGDVFDLLDWGSVNLDADGAGGSAAFAPGTDLVLPTLSGGLAFNTNLFTTNGIIVVVPEPSRCLMLVGGLAALVMRRRRRL